MHWVLASIKDHIENAKHGCDMSDFAFGIRYKDGSTLYVTGNDLPEKHICVDRKKIEYCYENNPEDSMDSLGRTWIKDFGGLNDNFGETLEAWDNYTSEIMEKGLNDKKRKKKSMKQEDLDHMYHIGFAEGVKIHTENITMKIKEEIENGNIKIEHGTDKLFDVINYVDFDALK